MPTRASRPLLFALLLVTLSLLIAGCAPATPAPVPTAPPPPPSQPTAVPATTAPTAAPAAPTTAPASAAAPTTAPAATTAPTAAAPAATKAPAAGAPVATAPSRANLKGELVLNTWRDIGADPNHPNYSFHLLIQQWVANHPGVTVKYQPMLGTVTDIFGFIGTNLRSKTLQDGVVMLYPSPAQMDPDLQYDFAPDLAKPNPYSTNKTWRDDFPLDGLALTGVTTQGKVLMVSNTFTGDLGDGAILYNQEILDKAGVKALPKTWAEFMDALQKVKAAGFQALYMPSAGNESYIFGWQTGIFSDQLMPDVVKACDGVAGEKADGIIKSIEATYCAKKGKWTAQTMRTTFQLMKDLSPYFHEGYLAPPPPGDPFIQGKVAFRWLSRLNVATLDADPNLKFKWGSFYEPPLKDGTKPVRYGNSTAGGGGQYYFIPKTAVDKGKLDLALDLAQYVTSPAANQFWCTKQPTPCYAIGSTVDKIFPNDTVMQTKWKGFIEPGGLGIGMSGLDINNAFGPANYAQEVKIYQDYLGGTLNLDQALTAWQRLQDQLVDSIIKQHPEWGADKW